MFLVRLCHTYGRSSSCHRLNVHYFVVDLFGDRLSEKCCRLLSRYLFNKPVCGITLSGERGDVASSPTLQNLKVGGRSDVVKAELFIE